MNVSITARRLSVSAILAVLCVAALSFAAPAATFQDTIPAEYTNAEFWKMVEDFSEPSGVYEYQNFISNEISYQNAIAELTRIQKPGGVYLGVGPEQNFTYVAALRPRVAFVVDIRRQNMIVLLMYKALFEMAPDRADFLSRLFSRRRPAGLGPTSSVDELFKAFENAAPDRQLYAETLQAIKDRLIRQRQFKPSGDDEQKLELVLDVFARGGPMMDWGFGGTAPNNTLPSYLNLMTMADVQGRKWSYLASEDNYAFVRQMQQKNLIVPIVGDFGGPKALKAIGQYLRERGAAVTVFYVSNVEDYLDTKWEGYVANVHALPQGNSSVLIRFRTLQNTQLMWMRDVPLKWTGVQPMNQ